MTGVTNGAPAGVSFIVDGQLNMDLAGGATFPILDTAPGFQPFYSVFLRAPNTADRVHIVSLDTPFVAERVDFNNSMWGNTITRIDVTYALRVYLVWQFTDQAIYTLGTVDWRVVFKANTPPGDILTIDPTSIITADPARRSHLDPKPVIGPLFNATFDWIAV
jgi:hypothetical protein